MTDNWTFQGSTFNSLERVIAEFGHGKVTYVPSHPMVDRKATLIAALRGIVDRRLGGEAAHEEADDLILRFIGDLEITDAYDAIFRRHA